jgi:hypothetical protein
VHPEPVPDDNWVHNLEHGGILLLYRGGASIDDLGALSDLATEKGEFVVLTPYEEMESPFAVVSWGFRMTMGCVDAAAMGAFYDEHVDRAPESISSDPGPGCN